MEIKSVSSTEKHIIYEIEKFNKYYVFLQDLLNFLSSPNIDLYDSNGETGSIFKLNDVVRHYKTNVTDFTEFIGDKHVFIMFHITRRYRKMIYEWILKQEYQDQENIF